MYLQNVHLVNFKNHIDRNFDFCRRINCIIGANGMGKSNLLDAIHYLSMTKSYLTHGDRLCIRHNEDFFAIHGDFVLNPTIGVNKVSCIQQKDKRKIFKINQKEYERMADHIGLLPSVMISPYDTDYINGGSEIRRKYFDSVISQANKDYLNTLIYYNKVLLHRNALLKSMAENNQFSMQDVTVWNEKMLICGEKIHQTRKSFLSQFIDVFAQIFNALSPNETVNICYKSQLLENDFDTLLSQAWQADCAAQHSTVGIHKDDFLLTMNSFPVKTYCSQGQQKTFLIALKLSQFEYIKKQNKLNPLLLLDDLFDKLDASRIKELITLVSSNQFGQVFITDTHAERIKKLFKNQNVEHKIIEITVES
ncbi:MAG: DNA replication and repair protein RecF [Bacteroidales bacterium]|jgi:DNA replication and repair protein RecF|nr:DNA replication and repair protein RecF [Bacteroidales bacterium]